MIMRNLGFFATAEVLVANNIMLAIFRHVTNAECRQYLLRQAFEEAIHTHTFQYIVREPGAGRGRTLQHVPRDPGHRRQGRVGAGATPPTPRRPDFTTATPEAQTFLRDLVGYYVIIEGMFFYTGFARSSPSAGRTG